MEVHAKLDIHQAFVATSEDVTKIWKTLEATGMKVTATANCVDGLVRHFDTCESVVQYNNAERAAFAVVEISARSREPDTSAEISLGAKYTAPMSISLRGEEHIVSSIRTALTDVVAGMKPWYSRIATIELFWVGFPIFAVFYFVLQVMGWSDTPKPPPISFVKALGIVAIALAFIGVIAALCWGTVMLRKRFFPVATFAIGQGLARHRLNEKIRWGVIVGFLVGVVSSIVATIMLAITMR